MKSEIITTILVSLVTAFITYFFAFRLDRNKEKAGLLSIQRYKYFLPFKYSAKEFLARLRHIEKKLQEGNPKYFDRFSRKSQVSKNDLEWYFSTNAWPYKTINESEELVSSEGYFITSTIYMTCILFHRINKIQMEYPFIPIKLSKKLKQLSKEEGDQLQRCIKSWKENDFENEGLIFSIIEDVKTTNIDLFFELIRVSFALTEGIPFSLHDSYGGLVVNEDKIINFESFSEMLMDARRSIPFKPLINFWTGLVEEKNGRLEINTTKMRKLHKLIVILTLIQNASVRNKRMILF